jgi:cysteine/O-acetylserine efflux protein
MAVLHGYKNTLKYQVGLAAGVFVLMLFSGWFSTMLLNLFPALEPILRYAGAGYILYLAFGILKASYSLTEQDVRPLGAAHGLMLQILNPKLTVYAFTLFSGFLASTAMNFVTLLWVCMLLAAISFCATSTWALFGTTIRTYLHNPRLAATVNIGLSLMLVYSALTLVEIP